MIYDKIISLFFFLSLSLSLSLWLCILSACPSYKWHSLSTPCGTAGFHDFACRKSFLGPCLGKAVRKGEGQGQMYSFKSQDFFFFAGLLPSPIHGKPWKDWIESAAQLKREGAFQLCNGRATVGLNPGTLPPAATVDAWNKRLCYHMLPSFFVPWSWCFDQYPNYLTGDPYQPTRKNDNDKAHNLLMLAWLLHLSSISQTHEWEHVRGKPNVPLERVCWMWKVSHSQSIAKLLGLHRPWKSFWPISIPDAPCKKSLPTLAFKMTQM